MYIGHPKKVYDFSLQQLLYILRMVQNCQSIINQLALAIGEAKLRRELLLFKNHPNVPIMSKKITNSICIFRLLKLNQEERSLLRSHTQLMTDGRCAWAQEQVKKPGLHRKSELLLHRNFKHLGYMKREIFRASPEKSSFQRPCCKF